MRLADPNGGMTQEELTAAGRRALLECGPRARGAVHLGRVLAVGNRYHVRASMRPHPLSTIHRVSKLPHGNVATDPIPIQWFKPNSGYTALTLTPVPSRWLRRGRPPPAPTVVDPRLPQVVEVPPTQWASFATPSTLIGVLPHFWTRPFKTMRRTLAAGAGRSVQGRMRTFFTNYSVPLATMQIDHVQDIGWNGPDAVNNLWPLSTALNQGGNRSYDSPVWYERAGVGVRSNPGQLVGRWFQIRWMLP